MIAGADVGEVHDGKYERGDSDECWPERDEEVGERGVEDRWVASDVFENVEPVSLNDNGWKIGLWLGRCARSV